MSQLTYGNVYPVNIQNLFYYRIRAFDTYPHLNHAIFTRKGGVSQPPYSSLNLSISVGDNLQAVQHNVKNVCQAINTITDQTVSCHLVHGADILTINKANQQQVMGQADGLITDNPNIFLFMRFGDCAPLVFFDPVRNAVGLSHAGWRGTAKNVAGATVKAMVTQLGCRPQDIFVVIGPAIGPCCYEVGQDVISAMTDSFANADTLFTHRNGNGHQAYFNLWEANRRQLAAVGVERIIQSELCTACRTDEFFSHREIEFLSFV